MLSDLPNIKTNFTQEEKIVSACVIFEYDNKIRYFPCFRHGNGRILIKQLYWIETSLDLDSENYGFLTSYNRFVNRQEAFEIVVHNWQLRRIDEDWKIKIWYEESPLLYSEDLW